MCRIEGLTSAAGATLNGCYGQVQCAAGDAVAAMPDDRVTVCVFEGEGTNATSLPPKAIRRRHLFFLISQPVDKTPVRHASGVGALYYRISEDKPGQPRHCKLGYARMGDSGRSPKEQSYILRGGMLLGMRLENIDFDSLDELEVPLQFLLSCGILADVRRAQACLQRMIDANCRAAPTAPETAPPAALAAPALVDVSDSSTASSGGALTATATADSAVEKLAVQTAALMEMELPSCTIVPAKFLSLTRFDAGLGKLRVPGAGLTALEWAARCGNTEIVEWLVEDERTSDLLRVGSPVGWACYAGEVNMARDLIDKGADKSGTDAVRLRACSRARVPAHAYPTHIDTARPARVCRVGSQVLWRGLPPFLVAAENGQEEAMDFLLTECRVSIHTTCEQGLGILYRLTKWFDDWEEYDGIVACEKLAKLRGAKEQYIKWK